LWILACARQNRGRGDADAGADEEHGTVGSELAGYAIGHKPAEHWDSDIKVLRILAIFLGGDELLGDALEVARAGACAGAVAPVGNFVDDNGDFDEAAAGGDVAGAGYGGVLGEGIKAGH